MHASISMAGLSKSNYQNPDDTFNAQMWKDRVDTFRGIDLDEFIQDGTIIAHTLIDDLGRQHWGGQAITNAQLDELAHYSKQIWPNMTTVVRSRATKLVDPDYGGSGTPYDWQYLDAAWDQFSARMSPVSQQINDQVASAKEQGLGLIVGLNVLTGGDGSSGLPGPDDYSSDWAMSPAELREYGSTLINHPYACAFMMWSARYDYKEKYDYLNYTYFKRPEIKAAMTDLSELAATRTTTPCTTP